MVLENENLTKLLKNSSIGKNEEKKYEGIIEKFEELQNQNEILIKENKLKNYEIQKVQNENSVILEKCEYEKKQLIEINNNLKENNKNLNDNSQDSYLDNIELKKKIDDLDQVRQKYDLSLQNVRKLEQKLLNKIKNEESK